MRNHGTLILLFLIILSFSFTLAMCDNRLEEVSTFAVYYGDDEVDKLALFDLAILSPMISGEAVEKLNSHNVVTVGYISIATIGGWEPWANLVSKDMVVGENPTWGEKIVNACSSKWLNIIVYNAIPYVLNKGFKGVFLDNLDVIDEYPYMKSSIVEIIRRIREANPNIVIIVNRGFSISKEIAPYIDAILFEDFGTHYDFSKNKYLKWTGSDYEWMVNTSKFLKRLSEEFKIKILALGYADLNNETMLKEYCEYVYSLALKYGFIPYVTNIHLNRVNTKYLPPLRTSTITSSRSLVMDNTYEYSTLTIPVILTIAVIVVVIVLIKIGKK